MKQFIIWLIIVIIAYTGVSVTYHIVLSANPRKVLIAVDKSVSMKGTVKQITESILDLSESRHYSVYSIITQKSIIHSWESRPSMGDLRNQNSYFGFRDFEKLIDSKRYNEINEANELVFITNAEDISMLEGIFKPKKFIRLNPLTP